MDAVVTMVWLKVLQHHLDFSTGKASKTEPEKISRSRQEVNESECVTVMLVVQ